MKRILLAMGVVATAFLIGCGGGGGGGSTPSAPSNPGNPGGGGGGGTSTATPGPTPTPSQSQNPTSTVVTIGTPGPITQTAINPLGSGATQVLTTTGRISATQNGSPMSAGAAINVSITSSDKSGNTCLVYIANGATAGNPCTYPAAGSTPAPVTIAHVGDGIAVQYNDGPMAPGGSFTIAGTVPGAGSQPAPVTESNPAPSVGHNTTAFSGNYGNGGILYSNGNIYTTQNSASTPIGITSYTSGTAGSAVSNMLITGTLTNAPAGGLILGPDGNLWGTEQNASKVFKVSPLGGPVVEVAISCPNGSAGGSGTAVLGPQTGITSGGGNVYVLCADEANHSDGANNAVNTINPTTDAVTTCTMGSGGGRDEGAFANGVVYSNGNLYTEDTQGGGGRPGGASAGDWVSIPASNCGNFTESNLGGATINGYGNLVLMSDGNLYSEDDGLMASTSFGGVTAANPSFVVAGNDGGGGLVQDTVLGSKWFFGISGASDLIANSSWTGGSQYIIDAYHHQNYVPLSAGGTASAAGKCEEAFNAGGGVGIIQLPDGKLAWMAESNWVCFANL